MQGQIRLSFYWSLGQTPPLRFRFASTQASRCRHVPSARTLTAPSPSPVLRSNRRCRHVSDLPPSLDAFESFARARRTSRLLDSSSSSPTWPTPSSSPCTLVLPCTMWTAHDSARPPRVPRSRSNRIHPSPSWSLGRNVSPHRAYSRPSFTTVLQHESFA